MLDKQILFESDHVVVIGLENHAHPDATVFVTFNEIGLTPDGTRFWAESLISRMPNAAIGVVSKTSNWYPPAAMSEALPHMLAFLRGRPVITYGHSQGGYGALKYAAALNARGVLAFCPQWSIDPGFVGTSDPRFIHCHNPQLENGAPVTAADIGPNAFAFFDPYLPVDIWNVGMMRDFATLHAVIVPFSGHETVRLLSEARIGAEFLATVDKLLLAEMPAPQITGILRQLLRKTRAKSPTYFSNRNKALVRCRKINLLAKLLKAGTSTLSDDVPLVIAAERNNTEEANRLLLTLPFETIASFGVERAWRYVRTNQLRETELHLARLVIANRPDNAFLLLHMVNSFITLNMTQEAAVLLTDIVTRLGITDRANARHIVNFARILKLPGLQGVAETCLRNIA